MTYAVVGSDRSDRYEADRDAHSLSQSQRDPEYAGRWYNGLVRTVEGLAGSPGPLSHA